MSKQPKTAAELMTELRADPAFRQRELEADLKRAHREQEYSNLLQPILSELQRRGFKGASLEEVLRAFAPLPTDAVEVLLSGFSAIDNVRVKESLVRALGAAKDSFDGQTLVACFQRTDDEALKWAILNTIALTSPESIDDWLAKVKDTPTGETLRKLASQT
jgi:hypothetical protein